MKRAGPLAGIKVLDFTRVLAGPYCTALLADLGADVVKVEAATGDDYRHIGPFRDGESALFQLVNRNKRSLVLDLKRPAAQALAQRLAARADVVVENFRPGVAARLGIGYDTLSKNNSRLIYASISGFGQSGPKAELPAYDLIAQAVSGMMAMTGDPAGPPMKQGDSFGDITSGVFASWAILAALFERTQTGKGRSLDVAMVDSLVSLLPTAVAQWMFGATPPARSGNQHPLSTPFGAYRASDGHVILCVLSTPQFGRLADVMGRPEIAADPRFASDEQRTQHRGALQEIIERWLTTLRAADAVEVLSKAGIAASVILEPATVFEGDYVRERAVLSAVAHPRLGSIPAMEQPVHFSGLPRGRQDPAPDLGADNRTVLKEWLDINDAGVDVLGAEGALGGGA